MRNDDGGYQYHKTMHDKGLARCILMVAGRVSYSYTRIEWAGQKLAMATYPNGERLPLHAVKGMEGDSYQALSMIHPARKGQDGTDPEAKQYPAETRFADSF